MSQQIQISGGAKVRNLQDVIIGTSGVLSSLAFDVANGVPKLDSNGKILVSQLPNSVMEYKGTWNAATNTPTLVNGTGNQGDVWLCTTPGTVNFGAGPITFISGDSAVYSGSIWQRSGGATGSVTSVGLSTNGGAITIGNSPITTSGVISANFNGTNLQYVNGAGNLTTFPTLMTSVGLTMPSAFTVTNSPLTGAGGTLAVTGAGYASQYIRGDGTLADFPSSGGGGSSVSYYLNGGTSQGTIGGTTYYEMSKTADTGTGVDFTKSGDGFIVAFLTDANDPAQLNIPAGNWNYEIYASMSANGGTPQMYAELYKYDGTTFTLISTSTNEILYDGTNLNLYTFGMTVPATTLALTDRLAIKLYATNSGGKTTTVHTQDSHLCQVITTFSTGITALNGLTAQVQYFQTGTSGTDFNISSTTATHTFNIPDASATTRGLITTGTQTIAGIKTFSSGINVDYIGVTGDISMDGSFSLKQVAFGTLQSGYTNLSGQTNGLRVGLFGGYNALLNFSTSGSYTYTFPAASGTIALTSNLSSYVPTSRTLTINGIGYDLSADRSWTINSMVYPSAGIALSTGTSWGTSITDNSANWNTAYTNRITSATAPLSIISNVIAMSEASGSVDGFLSRFDWTTFNNKQATITLTTTGTSGAATFTSNTLNIPNYGSALGGYLPLTGGTLTGALGGTSAVFSGSVTSNGTLIAGLANGNIRLKGSADGFLGVGESNGTLYLTDWTTGAKGLSILLSTGAATFSSTIQSGVAGNGFSRMNKGSSTQAGYFEVFKGDGSTRLGYMGYDNTNFAFTAENSAVFTFTGGDALFQFAGNRRIGIDYDTTGAYFYGFATNSNARQTRIICAAADANAGISFETGSSFSGATTKMLITSGGNVLIGTTTDSGYKLDVNGTGRFSSSVRGLNFISTSRSNTIDIGNVTNYPNYNFVGYDGYWGIRTDLSNGFNIDTYNVGTPKNVLTITQAGAATFSSSVTAKTVGDIRQATLGSISGAALYITNNNYAGYGLLIGNSYSYGESWIQAGRVDGTATAYNLTLQVAGGKVLIGTTADNGQLLQVNGTVLATGFFESSSVKGKDIIATNPLLALDIDVIKYTRKSDESKDIRYGYSAEQIHSLMPELTDKDVTSVKYLDVHTILISQLQQEIKELKAKMN